MTHTLSIVTRARNEMVDITALIQQYVHEADCESGVAFCFVPHTTAGITINENADPDVRRDLIHKLNKEIPQQDGYHHAEGNSDAHLKASLMGFSELILFENKQLILGQWQAVYFCEFDGPRNRQLILRVGNFG